MALRIVSAWTEEIHREFHEHTDPPSGLSMDCERCRSLAVRLADIYADHLRALDVFDPMGSPTVRCGHA